jgi:hypothetical protein
MLPRLRRAAATPLVLIATAALAFAACGPSTSPSPSSSGVAPTTPPPSTAPSGTPTGTTDPGPSTDPDHEALYQAIEEAVVDLRGLEPKADVAPRILDEQQVKERAETSFRRLNPEELIEANQVLYSALGMIEADEVLADLYIELTASQVAGFYDFDADELFVVARSGEIGVVERVTYAHEFNHALQDQYFDLTELLRIPGEGDAAAAHLALVEGDATAVMAFWAQGALTPQEAIELLEESQSPEQQAILERMPPILRESLTFPYEQGLQFVLRLQAGGGGWEAVDAAYDDPPASTEQVLHPEKYDAREDPVDVELPDDLAAQLGPDWSVPYEDTFGEFQFQVWLRNAIDRDTGNAAAEGWGGDRFAVLKGPDDRWAVVMVTTWDTADDATEFQQAAGTVIGDGDHPGTVLADGRDATIVIASDGDTLNEAVSAAGFVVGG